ncbi:predicted protein [Nematostella vectensis]|uniref:Programmed cell death protein 4 n=1 Tax=Nematostella vectensis TaxID=45351 RepID=A7SMV1_NEMVE|nr:programmed cell death protein 4 isoform X2 [Nematostella vectensis]EDO34959.1 predicted protein [Nematostella vectensis]|eukprot:XP_001627059.1 predicted protein [Nematostella vectensis]
MASSGNPATVPTASTKKMRIRSKSTSDVGEVKSSSLAEEKQQIRGTNASTRHGINGSAHPELSVKASEKRQTDRKPRTGRRGLPKKGGAGGKGTWGVIGEVLTEEDLKVRDQHDPNYESEEDETEPYEIKEIKPELTVEEFELHVDPIIVEYFEHGDTEDVDLSLQELNISNRKFKIVVFAVTHALDRKATQREMASVLISDLYGSTLTRPDIASGFQKLLDDLDDLSLDTPDAPEVLGKFIARAIADDCLSPAFVANHADTAPNSTQRKALEKANTLIKMKHGMVRLDNVWGVAGGRRPVKYLVKKMELLLKEYLSSEDVEEACRCVQELDVPHFHHELVYEAIMMVLEEGSERVIEVMNNLFKDFHQTNIVTPDQIRNGFIRVFDSMGDIVLDIPHAHIFLEKLVDASTKSGVIPISLTLKMPSRGRKRFVSEGDGGLVKA